VHDYFVSPVGNSCACRREYLRPPALSKGYFHGHSLGKFLTPALSFWERDRGGSTAYRTWLRRFGEATSRAQHLAPYPGEFAEAFEVLGRLHALPADGESHITHIEVAARIRRDPVGGDELRWPFPLLGLANAGL
jgi:hypothetical protein